VTKHRIAPTLAVAALLAGCVAGLPATIQPSGSASPAVPTSMATGTASPTLVGASVEVVAGTGQPGSGGDGGPATSATLSYTVGMAFGPDGSLYIADARANRVRRIDAAGMITTVAGTGPAGSTGDGGPATIAELSSPDDLVVEADGSLIIAESDGNRVRRVDPAGVISTIAGTGAASDGGDGGLAASASVNVPDALALAADGTLFVSTPGHVRRIGPDGRIDAYAGTGATTWDPGADGGPATRASFADASSSEIGPDGALYLADFLDCRILRIASDGTITSIAGTGCTTFRGSSSGDGGPATEAELARPADLAFTPTGDLLILEHFGSLRRVDATGTITTVPIAWRWQEPLGMVLHGNDLYVGDRDHHQVIRVRVD
jgi:serine/threonine-protein kinase